MPKRDNPAHWRDESRGGVRRPTSPTIRRHLQAAPSRGAPTSEFFLAPRGLQPSQTTRPDTTHFANSAIGVLTGWNCGCFRGLACPL